MSFGTALPVILAAEGGAVDDPLDHGGRTNFGITQKTYDEWRTRNAMPLRDVFSIRDDEVSAIYLGIWNDANCPVIPWPLSLVHFDARVNHRPNRANLLLQEALGVKVDGIIGPATLAAAIGCNPIGAASLHCERREAFYHRIVERDRTQERFLKSWLRRLDNLRLVIQQAKAA